MKYVNFSFTTQNDVQPIDFPITDLLSKKNCVAVQFVTTQHNTYFCSFIKAVPFLCY